MINQQSARLVKFQAAITAMSNPEIRSRSETEYAKLAPEIEGGLPPFDAVYSMVEGFYRGLPW